jgi:hypothetical protein
MRPSSAPPDDTYLIRCPRLGHPIYFSYCRRENNGLPCFKTLDCWHEHFLVAEFLSEEIAPQQWTILFESPPKPKILSLVEMMEQARKRKDQEP